jgi:hypothetical protein
MNFVTPTKFKKKATFVKFGLKKPIWQPCVDSARTLKTHTHKRTPTGIYTHTNTHTQPQLCIEAVICACDYDCGLSSVVLYHLW